MKDCLRALGAAESVIDDALLVPSELLTNACLHGSSLGHTPQEGDHSRAAWRFDRSGRLTIEVTDGGGRGRTVPAALSLTARWSRPAHRQRATDDWGVHGPPDGQVTAWAAMPPFHLSRAHETGPRTYA